MKWVRVKRPSWQRNGSSNTKWTSLNLRYCESSRLNAVAILCYASSTSSICSTITSSWSNQMGWSWPHKNSSTAWSSMIGRLCQCPDLLWRWTLSCLTIFTTLSSLKDQRIRDLVSYRLARHPLCSSRQPQSSAKNSNSRLWNTSHRCQKAQIILSVWRKPFACSNREISLR